MGNAIQPARTETVPSEQALVQRLQKYRADLVPKYSTQTRVVYWSKGLNMWILVTHAGNGIKLAYFPMEQCPCQQGG